MYDLFLTKTLALTVESRNRGTMSPWEVEIVATHQRYILEVDEPPSPIAPPQWMYRQRPAWIHSRYHFTFSKRESHWFWHSCRSIWFGPCCTENRQMDLSVVHQTPSFSKSRKKGYSTVRS